MLAALGTTGFPVARPHCLDPETIGIGDYGRPGNYFSRQIARWSRQYLDDHHAGRDANMDALIAWLPAPGSEFPKLRFCLPVQTRWLRE